MDGGMTDAFNPYIAKDRTIGPFRFDMHIEDPVAKDWYDSTPNQWQRERQWCMDTIRPGFNVLDVGAHQGLMTTLFALCTGPSGTVHAWEALPSNAALVERNAALNGLHNVVVHPRGVGSAPARLPMFENQGNIVVLGAQSEYPVTGSIDIVRLDDDVDPAMRVDFLKIDVEGHDLHALNGAQKVLSQRPFLMLELHNFLFQDRQQTVLEIVEVLKRYDYYVWVDDFTTATDIGRNPDPVWLASLRHAQLYCSPVS
jgi:FkbM family methyltransferase